ncbi:MAG: two-component system, chemotaxis family, sensor histidine kinase and response regulator WspE [Actinomycetota bacterium]|jgi:chemotaxis protein histidine kinase CheA|nr:two-component system, chemotaxis family, sensor histidine kinase and response regulator WspE [Actinomycetota bacterium]
MPTWADDPELLATFRAEVEERLASLQSGLLELETHASPRQVVTSLFRDAHTVKGSARMLGLEGVLHVSHGIEDLLGALRDGRFPVRRDLIDLLLASCDGISRALPGENSLPDEALEPLTAALKRACDGEDPVVVPVVAPTAVALPLQPIVDDHGGSARHDSVRVAASKVYDLLDAVGEADLGARRVEQATGQLLALAAEQARWVNQLRKLDGLPPELGLALHRLGGTGDEMAGLVRGLRELVESHRGGMGLVRDGAMGLAMVPVRRVFAALPRILRDVAQATGKDVRLVTSGEDVELDKQVLDGVADALKHLVINAVDHGCEDAVTRIAAGKPEQATVTVSARSVGGTVVLEVSDDGAGVDEDAVREKACEVGLISPDSNLSGPALLNLLFTPAFTTSDAVTETSGRGVGLDVVRDAVEELGGAVEVRSEPGVGTSFVLTLPVTLGVLRCLVARVGDERYAVPVPGVVESISLRDAEVHTLAGASVVVRHGVSVPLLDLGAALGAARNAGDTPRAALLVRHASSQVAWAVDRLEGESELVVKDLGPFLGRIPSIAGATIDGDGSVVCLLDLRELADKAIGTPVAGVAAPAQRKPAVVIKGRKPRVLVVEDSVGVRELERVILEGAGYQVETAVDGLDGASRLRDDAADLVLSDVEMPGMDGFELTRTIRRTKGWENVPVIIMTSRGEDTARQAGLDAGASAYLLKNEFDQEQLVQTVRRLVGR